MNICSKALFDYLLTDLRSQLSDSSYDSVMTSLSSGITDYWPGASAREVASLRLAHSLLRKLRDEEKPDAKVRCLKKFLQSDELCENWHFDPQNSRDEELVGLLEQETDMFLHPEGEPLVESYYDLLKRGRAGPGASVGANGVDFYTKFFSSRLSATSVTLYDMYNTFVAWYPDWRDAEISRAIRLGTVDIVSGSAFSYVRKNVDIARSICTEPSLNMFYQLGLGAILEDRLDVSFNINMATQQTWNRSMACHGSLQDGLVTIDLESASDSFSCSLCERLFPNWFNTILDTIRSPATRIENSWMKLNMISSMGNGFTFPLQTMLFSCVVRAALRFRGIEALRANQELLTKVGDPQRGTWGVFGDDIICHRDVADDVCRLLTLIGFRVNSTKSYFQGPFRESCGADYYNGQLVRGVYLKSLLTQQNRYVAINRLNEWSAVTGIFLPQTIGYLRDSVVDLAVPYFESDDAGIRTLSPPDSVRYNENQSFLYRKYEVDVPELIVGDSDVSPVRRRGDKLPKARIYNPLGLLCSFLAGYVRNYRISLALKQGERPRYRTRWLVTPFWDHFRPGSGFAADPVFWTPRVTEALRSNLIS